MSLPLAQASGWEAAAPPPTELLRLHRRSLIHLLLVGGTANARARLAMTFHRESPLGRGPFVRLDGGRDEDRLRCALQCSLSTVKCPRADSPLLASEGGTLFVDHVERLTLETQHLFVRFLGRLAPAEVAGETGGWFGRLAAGTAEPLEAAVAAGRFLPALYDCLDKIRIELPLWSYGGAA